MKTFIALIFIGSSLISYSASAQSKKGQALEAVHLDSGIKGPTSEIVTSQWNCGKYGGHAVTFVYSNIDRASALRQLRVDGHEFSTQVEKKISLSNSHLVKPYLICRDIGVIVGFDAIDRKTFRNMNVEITIDSKTSNVSIQQIENSKD